MNDRTRFRTVAQVIAMSFIALVAALWLAPAASAQGITIASGRDMNTVISPGDTLEAGIQVSPGDSQSGAITVSVTGATGLVTVSCPDGKSQTVNIIFSFQTLSVPSKNSGWFPPDDNTYQGKGIVPSNLCGGKPGYYRGTIFTASYGKKCDDDRSKKGDDRSKGGDCCHPVCFRFHFSCNHKGGRHGGSWDDDDRSCKNEPQCISAQNRDNCSCKGKDHD